MHVVLKLKSYDKEIMKKLSYDSHEYRATATKLLIELKPTENEFVYRIPDYIIHCDYEVLISEFEYGGRSGNTGLANIVCTTRGEKQLALFSYRELRPNDNHVCFSLNRPFITIKAYCPGCKIVIEKWTWQNKDNEIILSKRKLFEDDLDNLYDSGPELRVLSDVAFLTHLKACIVDCKEIFYAILPEKI